MYNVDQIHGPASGKSLLGPAEACERCHLCSSEGWPAQFLAPDLVTMETDGSSSYFDPDLNGNVQMNLYSEV